MPFYERGDVRIRYEEVGSGFPLLVTPGGGLNSRAANWPSAVINAMDAFKDDFRCITMDQRNANGGESTGPLAIDDPWGGFGSAPKFPPHGALEVLLRHHHRTGDEQALFMATRTLDRMRQGGIYDHVGGGFARY